MEVPNIDTLNDLMPSEEHDRYWNMLNRLPIAFDWCRFKEEDVFAGVNYEATVKAGKPMLDIYHCATTAMNNCVLATVQFDRNKFAASKLSSNNKWNLK